MLTTDCKKINNNICSFCDSKLTYLFAYNDCPQRADEPYCKYCNVFFFKSREVQGKYNYYSEINLGKCKYTIFCFPDENKITIYRDGKRILTLDSDYINITPFNMKQKLLTLLNFQ